MKRIKGNLVFWGALAAPMWAGTYTAASCNYSDVNAVINGPTHTAVAGDIIQIPAGTCTWTNTLAISVGVTLTGNGTPNTGPGTFGAGTTNTIIVDNINSSPIIAVYGSNFTYGQTFTLVLLDIEPKSTSTALWSPVSIAGTCTSSGCPSLRIHNVVFGATTQWSESGNGTNATTMIRIDNVFGVLDHNTIPTGSGSAFYNSSFSAYFGVGNYGDNSWAQPDSFGSANNLFAENNSIFVGSNTYLSDSEFSAYNGTGWIGGSRQVGRFNHITTDGAQFVFGHHGLETGGRARSGRQIEAYGNTISNTPTGLNSFVTYRGGTGFTFGNTLASTSGAWLNTFANLNTYRIVFAANPWNACGGLNSIDPFDTNDNTVYYTGTASVGSSGSLTLTDASNPGWTTNQWVPTGAPYTIYDVTQGTGFFSEVASNTSNTITIQPPIVESGWTGFNNGDAYEIIRATVCADQSGHGQGNYISGFAPTPAAPLSEALDPIYEWDDVITGPFFFGNVGSDTARTIANRDWYTDNAGGNPHAQTSPTSPFNGTSGVGFGTLANRPTTCSPSVGYFATDQGSWNSSGNGFGQGELFVCTATNTWGSTPYYTPYSYPHPLTQGTVAPPTGLTATVQ